jgi:DNA-binding YbaB/EbfC family protein
MGYQDDMQAFLQQAQEITAHVQAVGAQMAKQEVVGVSEGGGVQITMTSGGEVHGVRIQPSVVNPDNLRGLEQLVAEAVQNAMENMRGQMTRQMEPFADSFNRLGGTTEKPQIP